MVEDTQVACQWINPFDIIRHFLLLNSTLDAFSNSENCFSNIEGNQVCGPIEVTRSTIRVLIQCKKSYS